MGQPRGVIVGTVLATAALFTNVMPANAIINGTVMGNDNFAFVGRYAVAIVAGKDEGKNAWCTASLIDDNWAISARHCFDNTRPAGTEIVFGRRSLADPGVRATVIDFVEPRGEQDVILLALDRQLSGIEPAHPVAPWDSNKWKTGTTLSIAGWGAITLKGRDTDQLRRADHVVVDTSVSADHGKIKTEPAPGDEGHWAFHGDSGGPLVYREPNGKWTLVGVFSQFSGGKCYHGQCAEIISNRWGKVGKGAVAEAIGQAFKAH
jgi:Trypsin